MTSPEDEDPEESLRRALSEAVSGVEPGADGLDKIRARIGNRPPRPWPLSVLFGLIDRVRNWTWHGHWAWQESLPRPRAFWRPRSRRSNFPGWGTGGLRLVTVLAGIAVIAGISLGVSPFRNATLQASTDAATAAARPRRGTAATAGNATRTPGSTTPTAGGPSRSGQIGEDSSLSATKNASTAAPGPTSTASCASPELPASAGAKPSPTDATAAAPATRVPSPLASSPSTSLQPSDTNSRASTCPVTHPASSPTPTATSSPTPTATSSPTPTATRSPTPTATSSPASTSARSPAGAP